ncbi:hypothetical protein Tco_0857682 [Tanacetum coccineum]|uniref:Retrovirus-related Pol polyprotein from transposon TNT 1-94-like beta-barrel domain-containing protein n=1 Tax=Tanacetum coccineum TaxID=301880 RepID=A0ABQ5B753_9ASTR
MPSEVAAGMNAAPKLRFIGPVSPERFRSERDVENDPKDERHSNKELKEIDVISGQKNKDDIQGKLKGKAPVDNDVTKHPSDPKMLKIDVEPITPKLLNKQTAHSAYISHTQEQEATVLRDLVEHVKSKYPLDQSLESACRSANQPPSECLELDNSQSSITSVVPTKSSKKLTESKGTAHVQHSRLNANSELKCVKCNGCMLSANHDLCVLDFINNVTCSYKSIICLRKASLEKSLETDSRQRVVQIILWYLDSGCSKHMTGDCSQLTNFVNKFLGTVKFGNDHVAKILGYGDYQIGNVTISRVYYVEGLGHNLFSIGQFCDSNLEIAFRQHTCFIRNLEGVDLSTGSRSNN